MATRFQVAIYYLSGSLVNTSNTPLHIIKAMREDFRNISSFSAERYISDKAILKYPRL